MIENVILPPDNFQLAHITSTTSTPEIEPEIQIRYNDGIIEFISREEAFNRLMKEDLESIAKISWHYDYKEIRCVIVKGENVSPVITKEFNITIEKDDFYCLITNFCYNSNTTPKTEGKVYYKNLNPLNKDYYEYEIEVWNIYKIINYHNVIEI